MLEWLLFNVALPLLPIPLIRLVAWLIDKDRGFVAILRDGQLCFYATTLTATAIYDIANRGIAQGGSQHPPTFLILAIGGCIFVFAFSAVVYGVAVVMAGSDDRLYQRKFAWVSATIALFTTLMVFGLRWSLGLLT